MEILQRQEINEHLVIRAWIFLNYLFWGCYIISLLRPPPGKLEPWFVLWSFFLLRLLFVPINLPYGHVWNTAVMSELVHLVATWECWISYKNGHAVGRSLATSLEPLANRINVASLSLFYVYYFGRCSSELAQFVPLPYSRGRSTRYSDRLHDFFATVSRCCKDVYVNSFFSDAVRLWHSLPIECFPLTYDHSSFKSRINRHLLTVVFF